MKSTNTTLIYLSKDGMEKHYVFSNSASKLTIRAHSKEVKL